MTVGLATFELHVNGCQSLKDKRRVVKSLKDRLHQRFNVSVAECDDHDSWQRVTLGVVQVGNERDHVDRSLREVSAFIEGLGLAEAGEETYQFDNY